MEHGDAGKTTLMRALRHELESTLPKDKVSIHRLQRFEIPGSPGSLARLKFAHVSGIASYMVAKKAR